MQCLVIILPILCLYFPTFTYNIHLFPFIIFTFHLLQFAYILLLHLYHPRYLLFAIRYSFYFLSFLSFMFVFSPSTSKTCVFSFFSFLNQGTNYFSSQRGKEFNDPKARYYAHLWQTTLSVCRESQQYAKRGVRASARRFCMFAKASVIGTVTCVSLHVT